MASITTITTIAQHPKCLDLHLRNLEWSIGSPIKIFTFPWNNLPPRENVEYIYSDQCGTNGHFDFYGKFLPTLLDHINSDVILLMQQDILFTQPVHDLATFCYESNSIVLGQTNPEYFAVYNQAGNIVYPRLWEGAIFYPTRFLQEAAKNGVSMGYGIKSPIDRYTLADCYFKNTTTQSLVPSKEWLTKAPQGFPRADKFVELTIYSKIIDQPYKILDDYSVHFQGPEKTHRNIPNIYHDLEQLMTSPLVSKRSINNCAIMFYLAETIESNPTLIEMLLANEEKHAFSKFFHRMSCLLLYAKEWMSQTQYQRFEWAYEKIIAHQRLRKIF